MNNQLIILNYSGLPIPHNWETMTAEYSRVIEYSSGYNYDLEGDIWKQSLEHVLGVGNVFYERADYIVMLPPLAAPAQLIYNAVKELRGNAPKIAHVTRVGSTAMWIDTMDIRAWSGLMRGQIRRDLQQSAFYIPNSCGKVYKDESNNTKSAPGEISLTLQGA